MYHNKAFSYCLYKALKVLGVREVKLSHFLLALSQGLIEEVLLTKDLTILFRGKGSSSWHSTNAGILEKS